jgi:hypothetical protein
MSTLYIRDTQNNFVSVPALEGKSAYQYAVDGGYTGTEEEFAAKLAEEVDLSNYYTKQETNELLESVETEDDKYELIEDFNTAEQVTSIERTLTPDGIPYKYKKIYIDVDNIIDDSGSGKYVQLIINTEPDEKKYNAFRSKEGGETPTGRQSFIAKIDNGLVSISISGLTTNRSSLVSVNSNREYTSLNETKAKAITGIKIVKEVGFNIGDRIVIQGVRA